MTSKTSPSTKKRTPTPKTKPATETPEELLAPVEAPEPVAEEPVAEEPTYHEHLRARLDLMEQAFVKLATLTGNGNMLYDFDMKPWQPTASDMRKHEPTTY